MGTEYRVYSLPANPIVPKLLNDVAVQQKTVNKSMLVKNLHHTRPKLIVAQRSAKQSPAVGDQAFSCNFFNRRRCTEDGMRIASRYLATVRRAISMPSWRNFSTILSSDRTLPAVSASIICRIL